MAKSASSTAAKSLPLPQSLCETVNFSMMSGMPLIVTYWDDKGEPQTSWRGSTHMHDDGRLAMWIRVRNGGLVKALATNPKVRLAYRNPHTQSFVLFEGEGRVEEDEAANREIFDACPPMERAQDPQRKGIGVIVSINRVKGSLNGEAVALG